MGFSSGSGEMLDLRSEQRCENCRAARQKVEARCEISRHWVVGRFAGLTVLRLAGVGFSRRRSLRRH